MAIKINKNGAFGVHNTTKRTGKIEYIVIHYVGATGDAKNNVDYYNRVTSTHASADFFVGHKGDIWQYNPDLQKRYCWAVGGTKQSTRGGKFYGKCTNKNSVSIELCLKTHGNTAANSKDWYFTRETMEAAVELTRHLMDELGIGADHVLRHYDVTGKLCPGVYGWNIESGSESTWRAFLEELEKDELAEACQKLAKAGIINSPDYWAKGKGYSDENTVLLIKKFAAALKRGG